VAEIKRFTLQINAFALRLDSSLLTIKPLQNRASITQQKPYLPNVNKFDSVTYYFNTCLLLIKAKLLVNKEALKNSTEIGQFYYVYLRLESRTSYYTVTIKSREGDIILGLLYNS
jgi:hypothetical protein